MLCNMFQEKTATLGKSVTLIKSVLKTFQDDRSTICVFNDLWLEIQNFCLKNNVPLDISSLNQSNISIIIL